MAGQFGISAPLIDVIESLGYLLFGLGYFLVLLAIAGGASLNPRRRLMMWWIVSGGALMLPLGVVLYGIRSGFDLEHPIWRLLRPMRIAILIWLGLGCVLAGAGWISFFRRRLRKRTDL